MTAGDLNQRTHRVRSVVVNGVHLWECQRCGERYLPSYKPERLDSLKCGYGSELWTT